MGWGWPYEVPRMCLLLRIRRSRIRQMTAGKLGLGSYKKSVSDSSRSEVLLSVFQIRPINGISASKTGSEIVILLSVMSGFSRFAI